LGVYIYPVAIRALTELHYLQRRIVFFRYLMNICVLLRLIFIYNTVYYHFVRYICCLIEEFKVPAAMIGFSCRCSANLRQPLL